jgi:hypothetical protein
VLSSQDLGPDFSKGAYGSHVYISRQKSRRTCFRLGDFASAEP